MKSFLFLTAALLIHPSFASENPQISERTFSVEEFNPSPIFQDITRIAFFHAASAHDSWIHFSTLESYHRNKNGDRFVFGSAQVGSSVVRKQIVEGSAEGRSFAFCEKLNAYVIGSSLDPQIFLFNPATQLLTRVFRGPGAGMWIHHLAVDDVYAYTILSTPLPSVAGYEGIVKLNLKTGQTEIIPFTEKLAQGYGGVQTLDPSGRIWFYRAFPFRPQWFDKSKGIRDRKIPGYESWMVESWDEYQGTFFVLLSNRKGEFKKLPLDLNTLSPVSLDDKFLASAKLFLQLVPVDLYEKTKTLYFDPQRKLFFTRNANQFQRLGSLDLGRWEISGISGEPQETSVRWIHPTLGELAVLGMKSPTEMVIWLRGRKSYAIYDFKSPVKSVAGGDPFEVLDINCPNLSPSNITSLAVDPQGRVFGGGYLTMCHLFRIDAHQKDSVLLKGAIPHSEGQINSVFAGWDGNIYGAGYPDSILFRYDPRLPWKPGEQAGSNPINLGAMGHYHQTRAFKGALDLEGNVWYQSVTDFSVPIAHALAKADFRQRTLTVKTDLDDGWPEVIDVTNFDDRHILLLGRKDKTLHLFLVDQKTFQITGEKSVPAESTLLIHPDPRNWAHRKPILIAGDSIYHVEKDLATTMVHKSVGPVLRSAVWDSQHIVLVGQSHVEKLNVDTGASELLLGSETGFHGVLFRDLTWAPVVVTQGKIIFADMEKLMTLVPNGK